MFANIFRLLHRSNAGPEYFANRPTSVEATKTRANVQIPKKGTQVRQLEPPWPTEFPNPELQLQRLKDVAWSSLQ